MRTCYVVRNRIVGSRVSVLPGQPGRAWNWSMFLQKTQMNKEAGEALSESEEAQWLVYSEMGDWSVLTWTCSLLVLWNYLAAGYLKLLSLYVNEILTAVWNVAQFWEGRAYIFNHAAGYLNLMSPNVRAEVNLQKQRSTIAVLVSFSGKEKLLEV